MNQPTQSCPSAATTLFNLPDYRVISVVHDRDASIRVVTVASDFPAACPGCAVLASRVHSRRIQRVRDILVAGRVRLMWAKRRLFCDETLCVRKTFSESTPQVPRFARSTARLKETLKNAVIDSGRAASEVATAFGVSWWLVNTVVVAAAAALPSVDLLAPARLGIDEHRYRSVRWLQDQQSKKWTRYEPWMSTIVDVDTGQVLGIVDGRDSRGIGAWLKARPTAWLSCIETVGIDPSAAFRKALRENLPDAAVSVDHFHLVLLANDMLTQVRQRVSREQNGRRGLKTDKAWAHRLLLLRGYDTLSDAGKKRLDDVFATDDPSQELVAAWGVKEALRLMLSATNPASVEDRKIFFERQVKAAAMKETDRLLATVTKWWPEIQTLLATRVTTAKVEAANTMIKNIKRIARGFRNPTNYQSRILLRSAARTVA
ncbi:ISL3 family transposase [Arthrobacter livingstonensis]|uniref:ISL3 family transposase n=1 Tax=Arthrobacter livingstonensis TaxID=670078 RepID=A0A2V5L091_9MICC|nr:ISL3 family transposase [Arthrobacter livingstonensis]PYI63902.1 ISL3 family transposase [Arthrobacter livingstonensis]